MEQNTEAVKNNKVKKELAPRSGNWGIDPAISYAMLDSLDDIEANGDTVSRSSVFAKLHELPDNETIDALAAEQGKIALRQLFAPQRKQILNALNGIVADLKAPDSIIKLDPNTSVTFTDDDIDSIIQQSMGDILNG